VRPDIKMTKTILFKKYILEKKSIPIIANEVSLNHSTVHRYLIKYKIKRRNISQANHNKKQYELILTKDFLIREYIKNRKSTISIAKKLKCTGETVRLYLKKYNIKIRNAEGSNNAMFGKLRKDLQMKFKKEGNPAYIDGRTPLTVMIRSLQEYKNWRNKVFKRDNYTCQDCEQVGGQLEAHHKNSFAKLLQEFLKEYDQFSPIEDKETLVRLAIKWKPFWNINNGKTLCKNCHKLKR